MRFSYPPGATPLDPNEIEGLRPSSISTQAQLNEFEQANILDAQDWALGRRHKDVLSQRFLRELHKRMFGQVWKWAGRYRLTNKNIGVDWHLVPTEVEKLCADARFWIEQRTYERDELAARFHHRLVSTHPFPNGNGRHSRMAADALLVAHGMEPFSWGRGADLQGEGSAREQYLAALRDADLRRFSALLQFVRR